MSACAATIRAERPSKCGQKKQSRVHRHARPGPRSALLPRPTHAIPLCSVYRRSAPPLAPASILLFSQQANPISPCCITESGNLAEKADSLALRPRFNSGFPRNIYAYSKLTPDLHCVHVTNSCCILTGDMDSVFFTARKRD